MFFSYNCQELHIHNLHLLIINELDLYQKNYAFTQDLNLLLFLHLQILCIVSEKLLGMRQEQFEQSIEEIYQKGWVTHNLCANDIGFIKFRLLLLKQHWRNSLNLPIP